MTDEDFIATYYNSDDIPNLGRVLQAWYRDRGFEPWRYDGSNITRSSYGDNDETTPVNVAQYVRAVLGFMFALIIYFLILCYVCDRERTVSKQEVDHSIITKVNNDDDVYYYVSAEVPMNCRLSICIDLIYPPFYVAESSTTRRFRTLSRC